MDFRVRLLKFESVLYVSFVVQPNILMQTLFATKELSQRTHGVIPFYKVLSFGTVD